MYDSRIGHRQPLLETMETVRITALWIGAWRGGFNLAICLFVKACTPCSVRVSANDPLIDKQLQRVHGCGGAAGAQQVWSDHDSRAARLRTVS
jgi:hypothetical protein